MGLVCRRYLVRTYAASVASLPWNSWSSYDLPGEFGRISWPMPPQLILESFPTFPSAIPVFSVLVIKQTLYTPGQDLRVPRG